MGRGKLTYANVMATIGVIVAVGTGSAYAIEQIGTRDIKRDAVISSKIRDEAIRSRDLRSGAVNIRALDPKLVAQIEELRQKKSVVNIVTRFGNPAIGFPTPVYAQCHPGEVAVGGGFSGPPNTPTVLFRNGPGTGAHGEAPKYGARALRWDVDADNVALVPYVMCAQFG